MKIDKNTFIAMNYEKIRTYYFNSNYYVQRAHIILYKSIEYTVN